MELLLRPKHAFDKDSKGVDEYQPHRWYESLVDEHGIVWDEADDIPRYQTHPFSASCGPIIGRLDIEEGLLHIENKQDIFDYLLWIQLQTSRRKQKHSNGGV